MRVVGIDPGLSGALCLLHDDGLDIADMPKFDNRVDGYALAQTLSDWGKVDAVVVEMQQAYPRQGGSTSFKCGMGWGVVLGVVAALQRPLHHVSPAVWTKHHRVGADKSAHRRRACELWPESSDLFARVKDDGRADAALLADYGRAVVFMARVKETA